jgi:hypothetical protein
VTSSDDFPGDMHRYPFDDSDADVVFGGSSGSDPAPEELRDIAELVNAARRPGSADELVDEDAIVAQMAAVIGNPSARPDEDAVSLPGDSGGRIRVLHKFRTAKLAVATTAMVVMGATAAAAATGALSSPVQSSVSKGLSGVGISVPAPHSVALAAAHSAPDPHHEHGKEHPRALGVVASVNGVSTPGTCGTSGGGGSFTLTGHKGTTFIVNVDPTTTTFADQGVTDPSFADVCVGVDALAKGTFADTTVTATKVKVLPPRPPKHEKTGAFGIVASVNGVTAPGTCGTSGGGGSFTLTGHKGTTFIVNVDPTTTTFADQGVTDPSFANVCVGVDALAKGTVADTTVTADSVVIAPNVEPPEQHDAHGVFGTVASVNGVSAPGTCGTSGATGSFTITGWKGMTFTVNVDTSTAFSARGVTDPSFADICVGAKVGAKGDVTGMTIAATSAFVLPANDGNHGRHDHHQGDKPDGANPDDVHHGDHSQFSNGSDPSKNVQPTDFQRHGHDHQHQGEN